MNQEGKNNNFFGRKHSEEWKKSHGEKMKGNKFGIGYKHTQEWKKMMSEKRKGKKLTDEWKRNIGLGSSKALKGRPAPWKSGKNCSFWKGGITPINIRIRTSLEYKLWRESVFKRDNYTCIWCGAKSGNGKTIFLNADHIKPFYLYPELRFAIDNGRTLCVNCHKTTHTWGRPKKVESIPFPSLGLDNEEIRNEKNNVKNRVN